MPLSRSIFCPTRSALVASELIRAFNSDWFNLLIFASEGDGLPSNVGN